MPIHQAMAMTESDATEFFNGKSFKDWQKGREAEMKMQSAIVNRLNEVIRGLGIVAKSRSF
jgi:hypothetical protein